MEVSDTKLRRLRRERAWSIRELAQRAGVSTDTIYSLEHGRRVGLAAHRPQAGGSPGG